MNAQTLVRYLKHYRLTLDDEQMARRSVAPSTMSLLGMVRHLTQVEHHWFRRVLQEQPSLPELYDAPEDVERCWVTRYPGHYADRV